MCNTELAGGLEGGGSAFQEYYKIIRHTTEKDPQIKEFIFNCVPRMEPVVLLQVFYKDKLCK